MKNLTEKTVVSSHKTSKIKTLHHFDINIYLNGEYFSDHESSG